MTSDLHGTVGRPQLLVLAFGCVVGSGWVVVLGEWLAAAGPGGTILGLLAGAAGLLAVCAAYAELLARIPFSGGDFEFARRVFGPQVAFLVGWFSTLFLLCVASFEGIALGWILATLFPSLHGATLYRLFGADISYSAVCIGVGTSLALGVLHFRGIASAARAQKVVTAFFAAIALLVVAAGMAFGSSDNLRPLLSAQKAQPWWIGALWVFACAPFFLSGFQSLTQVVEERTPEVTFADMARAMYAAVLFGCAFYCAIVMACSMAVPWTLLPSKELPAVAAVETLLPHRLLARMLLVAAACSVLKVWNGMIIWAARLLMAQARARYLPGVLARIHPRHGSPYVAVMFVITMNICGILLGRGVLVPLLNMTSICGALTLVLASLAALRLRRQPQWQREPYAAPGGRLTLLAGLGAVGSMAAYACIEPFQRPYSGMPLEFQLLGGWGLLGVAAWLAYARRLAADNAPLPKPGR